MQPCMVESPLPLEVCCYWALIREDRSVGNGEANAFQIRPHTGLSFSSTPSPILTLTSHATVVVIISNL